LRFAETTALEQGLLERLKDPQPPAPFIVETVVQEDPHAGAGAGAGAAAAVVEGDATATTAGGAAATAGEGGDDAPPAKRARVEGEGGAEVADAADAATAKEEGPDATQLQPAAAPAAAATPQGAEGDGGADPATAAAAPAEAEEPKVVEEDKPVAAAAAEADANPRSDACVYLAKGTGGPECREFLCIPVRHLEDMRAGGYFPEAVSREGLDKKTVHCVQSTRSVGEGFLCCCV
jgi:hypothetical protein